MNLAQINHNDIADSDNGICISVWFNGCDIRCKGCHNEQLWDIRKEVPDEQVIEDVLKEYKLSKESGLQKSISILGGEPLSLENRLATAHLVETFRKELPESFIRLWTGRTKERINQEMNDSFRTILSNIDQVIVGPYIQEQRKILPLRGSLNQEVLNKSQIKKEFSV